MKLFPLAKSLKLSYLISQLNVSEAPVMKNILEQKFFPYVIKPGRYCGSEPGSIVKNHDNKTKFLYAFPDKYEIGMSYLGLQTLYHIINKDDRFVCERVFAVDNDAEEVMRQKSIPLFSLESSTPAKDFDAIGFTLSYELVYTNVLCILDLAGIPLHSKDRTDEHPIIMAGGPAAYNPEPMADFIDLFFVGDAEEGLPQMLEVLHENKGKSWRERLEALVKKVESVYVPQFYDENRKPLFDFVPEKVKARVISELKPEFYPDKPIIPLIEVVHQHLSVEIMRGCPQGCRFCQAGPIYRPMRIRSINDITNQVLSQLNYTGNNEITLLSLSSSDYPEIDKLASSLSRTLEKDKISVSLPSLRPGTISPKLFDAVSRVHRAGLTISPEAGTERLRIFIRKEFPDKAVYDTARMAFEKGWSSIKLYFMVGLPTETDDDLYGILNMIQKIFEIGQKYSKKSNINVTLSPFIPKPFTPFQWDEMIPSQEILRRIMFIKKKNRIHQASFKYPITESSMLQSLLGRGGRQMGKAIESVYKKGLRFDGWTEGFDYNCWVESFNECDIDIEQLQKPIPFDADLPWSHIEKGVSFEHLKKERHRTSTQLKDYIPYEQEDEKRSDENNMQYGRSKKKVASQQTVAPTKNRVRFRYGRNDKYKYMGHQDNLRLIEKLLRKAKLPVMYSQGFHPMMKLSFGPPLPLGFTSQTEALEVTFESNFMNYHGENLKSVMPDGFDIIESKVIMSKAPSLSSVINRIIYRLDINLLPPQAELEDMISTLLTSDECEFERKGKKEIKVIDIRPAIYDLKFDDRFLYMTLGNSDGGYVKPVEVLKVLLKDKFDEYLLNRIHRCEMFRIDENNQKINLMDL